MKKCLTALILFSLVSLLLAIPKELSREGNPILFHKLSKDAKLNLKSLPKAIQAPYRQLLTKHTDILMAYLLAYESNASLSIADPAAVQSNYSALVQLLKAEGLQYSPEFFLSYVAKQTVSDEPITPYRQALLDDGLQAIIDANPKSIDRYRATALWCVSRLQFQQTSGRDQSPLDITQKSLIGRCEEMQILFVAAARTVGLPSRPASTPWWAHMDNNHAWAEVWLDKAWHYTGDMDAAYFPDQTWFSGMIDKTVLILADGSLAADNDEILVNGRYETLINSTRNYAKDRSRLIKLQITDEQQQPIPAARIIPMVFNWGSLRALTTLSSDAEGKLQFTAGRGAFYLSVYYKGKKTLHYVPSGSEEVINLSITPTDNDFAAQTQIMEYPGNPMKWDNQPEAYRNAVQQEKNLWTEKTEAFTQALSSWLNAAEDSLAYAVAVACRGNAPSLKQFMQQQTVVEPGFWEFLLSSDPKILWQASAAQFAALYHNYVAQMPELSGDNEELSLLSPTVYYEELPLPVYDKQGKAQLYPREFLVQGKNTRETVLLAIKKLSKQHRVDSKKALSGLLTLDTAYKQKYLSAYQYRILACSALRANGIPAEFSRIPDLITVFVNGDWEYFNVAKMVWEDRSSQPGQTLQINLNIEDENGIPIQANDEQLNLCRYVEGVFYPLNHSFEYLGQGKHRGIFEHDDAYLQFGYRISDSETGFHLLPVQAADNDSLNFAIVARGYPRTWKAADAEVLAMLGDKILAEQTIILIGNHDQENSRRLAEKLLALDKNFLWIGYQDSPQAPANYQIHKGWQQWVSENSHNAMRSITLINQNGQWQMFEGLWDKLP
ncbi:MAG: transglutaminase-like domain-containing protein [Candidatus Cloacimonas sp.]|nr:transglutaminase-like domain-containing protein [Candidatus Cloacimonas sp.]